MWYLQYLPKHILLKILHFNFCNIIMNNIRKFTAQKDETTLLTSWSVSENAKYCV